jgi:hypothetical protein
MSIDELREALEALSDPSFVQEEGRALNGYWCRYCDGCLSYYDEKRYRPAAMGHTVNCAWVKARVLLGDATV